MSAHSVPQHCPYCGDERLVPHADEGPEGGRASHGSWECRSCLRAFAVRFVGLLAPGSTACSTTGWTAGPDTAPDTGEVAR